MERKWRYSGFQSATDTQVTLAATPVYSASNVFSITPATPPLLATDDIYYIVLKSDSSGVTNGNAFTVTIPSNGVTTSATPPTISAVTTQAITMDTVAPTITMLGPSNNATGVPISAMIGVGFSETMSPFSLNPSNITLTAGGNPVGAAINSFSQGFNLIISNPPTFAPSSRFARVTSANFAFYQMNGTSPIVPGGGSYVLPSVSDVVYFQHDTFPAEVGIVTNATLTSGTFCY